MDLTELVSLTLNERIALLGRIVPDIPWEVFGTISKQTLEVFFTERQFDFNTRATLDYLYKNHPLQATTKIGKIISLPWVYSY